MTAETRYLAPDWFTRNIFNRAVRGLTRLGISVYGSRELRVRGRQSGEWRTTPVNLLTLDGQRYLVAPRGVTQWVRNLRVAGTGELRVGRRVEPFGASEVGDEGEGTGDPRISAQVEVRGRYVFSRSRRHLQRRADRRRRARLPGLPPRRPGLTVAQGLSACLPTRSRPAGSIRHLARHIRTPTDM